MAKPATIFFMASAMPMCSKAAPEQAHSIDRIADFDEFDTLDISRLLNSVHGRNLAKAVTATETDEGTLISVNLGGRAGNVNVVLLEGVTDFDMGSIDVGRNGFASRGNAFGQRHEIEQSNGQSVITDRTIRWRPGRKHLTASTCLLDAIL
ncbi:MAG: hypothetical protein APF80_00755 [Alphaproteobacteria bacterium BRH_c36]|nr:MAG: hypothetical protein APF80_00755 [Alphaproteobacteria bacterium BRH_c36]